MLTTQQEICSQHDGALRVGRAIQFLLHQTRPARNIRLGSLKRSMLLAKVLALLSSAGAAAISIYDTAEMVFAVRQHYRSCGTSLLHTTSGLSFALRIMRLLSERGVPTHTIAMQTLEHRLQEQDRPLYVLLLADEASRQALRQVSHQTSLSSARWLLFLESRQGPLKAYFKNLHVPFDCELLVAQPMGSSGNVVLTEVYHVSSGSSLMTTTWGLWSPEKGLEGPKGGLYRRRRDLQGLVVKAAAIHSPMWMEMGIVNGRQVPVGGYAGLIWTILQRTLNFSLECHGSADHSWGQQLENTSWDGLIGMISRGDVDTSANVLGLNPFRVAAGDYSQPLVVTKSLLYIQQPVALQGGWSGVVAPFSVSLWLALFITVPVVAAVLAVLERLSLPNHPNELCSLRCYEFLYDVIGIFCLQGVTVCRMPPPCKLVVCLLYTTSISVTTAFCCNIIAFLTIQRVEPPFHTFEGMLQDSSYTLAVIARTHHHMIFKAAIDPILNEVHRKLILPENELPTDYKEGFGHICKKKRSSFFSTKFMANYFAANITCTLLALPETAVSDNYALLFRKHSPYNGLLTTSLEDLRRSGVLQLLRRQTWSIAPQRHNTSFSSVALNIVCPFFIIMAIGFAIAVLQVIMERLWWQRK